MASLSPRKRPESPRTQAQWNLTYPEVIQDAGESAKSLQRPGIGNLLEQVRADRVERIVVAKLDRLTRNVRDLSDLVELFAKHGVALVSVGETLDTSTSAGRMVVNMLGVVAQWEREAIGERTATSSRTSASSAPHTLPLRSATCGKVT